MSTQKCIFGGPYYNDCFLTNFSITSSFRWSSLSIRKHYQIYFAEFISQHIGPNYNDYQAAQTTRKR